MGKKKGPGLRSIQGGGQASPPPPAPPPPPPPRDPPGPTDGDLYRGELRNRLDALFGEARSYEYAVVNADSRSLLKERLGHMADGGWEVVGYSAVPDPKHRSGRHSASGDDEDADNLALLYSVLMRRGGLLVRK